MICSSCLAFEISSIGSSSGKLSRRNSSDDTISRRLVLCMKWRGGQSSLVIDHSAIATLSFDYLAAGARILIAVSGGIDVPLALGSRSTYPIGALGGFHGRALAAGDELPVGEASLAGAGRSVPEQLRRKRALKPTAQFGPRKQGRTR